MCREEDQSCRRSDEKDQRCKYLDTNRWKRMYVKCTCNTYTYPQSSKEQGYSLHPGQEIFDFVQKL